MLGGFVSNISLDVDNLFIGLFLDIIVLSMWILLISSERNKSQCFSLLGLFGLPVDFRFLDGYDILKNDGLIISLSVGFFTVVQ